MIVARGIVRDGLSTSPAGTVGAKLLQFVHNNPIVPTATNGINLRIVVIVCIRPASCAPRKLTHVNNQTTPIATNPERAGFVLNAGKRNTPEPMTFPIASAVQAARPSLPSDTLRGFPST